MVLTTLSTVYAIYCTDSAWLLSLVHNVSPAPEVDSGPSQVQEMTPRVNLGLGSQQRHEQQEASPTFTADVFI